MKISVVFVAISALLSGVNADSHGACGCQINTDGAIDTDSTQICCNRWFGKETKLQYLTQSGKVRFPGNYCLKSKIDGDSWNNCCREQLKEKADSACPW